MESRYNCVQAVSMPGAFLPSAVAKSCSACLHSPGFSFNSFLFVDPLLWDFGMLLGVRLVLSWAAFASSPTPRNHADHTQPRSQKRRRA